MLVAFFAVFGCGLDAYVTLNDRWPDGSIVMLLQLGSSGSLIDGRSGWDASAEDALAAWNNYSGRVKFRIVRDPTAVAGDSNGANNVLFSSSIYGRSFGSGILAVTTNWSEASTGARIEADVVFNTAFSWNSYSGPLRHTASGDPLIDLHRVALHEFGHVLGFMHEHQNPIGGVQWDFPRAIAYYRQGLPPGMPDSEIRRQLEVLPNSSKFKFSTFDPLSVMLYAIPEHIVLPGTWRPEMGRNNSELSPQDRRAAVELYGPTDDGDEVRRLTVDGDALTASIGRDSEVDRYVFTAPTDRRYQIETDGEAIVHVALADEDGKPVPGDFGADSISPLRGVRMPRLLDAGDHMLLVTASEFSPQTRGGYTIRVVSAE